MFERSPEVAELEGCTQPVFRIPPDGDAVQIGTLRSHERVVLVYGPDASAAGVTASLDAIAQEAPQTVSRAIVLTTADRLADFQQLIDHDRLFYLSCGDLSERDLDALTKSALGTQQTEVALDRFLDATGVRRIALAQSVPEFAGALRFAAAGTVAAERTRCILFDRERQVLWVPNEAACESTAAGLVSFILRTGLTVCLPRLDGDARFDRNLDDPGGDATDRFLGVPVRAGGAVVAVLVAIRPAHALPFEPLDIAAMEALAAHASPYAAAWLVEPDTDGPFRSRALREQAEPSSTAPELLRLDPAWTQRATGFVFATLVALLIIVAIWGWLS